MMEYAIRQSTAADKPWMRQLIRERWGDEFVVVHGVVCYPHRLAGFVAEISQAERVGLAAYVIRERICELVSLDSLREGFGIGTALLGAVSEEARRRGCSRLWCITTNDNLGALKFYQKRGFLILAVHPNEVERSRILKPSIPRRGNDGILIRDEIELEVQLS